MPPFLFEGVIVLYLYMTSSIKQLTVPRSLLKKYEGVVILPLREYERIQEELEMSRSKKLAMEIAKARKEQKFYSSSQVKKLLKIPN